MCIIQNECVISELLVLFSYQPPEGWDISMYVQVKKGSQKLRFH
jgi:hypothetical protein